MKHEKKQFEIQIDRVVVVGPPMDEKSVLRLRGLIEEAMREKMAAIRGPVHQPEGESLRIDLPGLSLDTIEGARRISYATAEAVMDALRGKNT